MRRWPEERSQIPPQITPYFSMRDELSVQDGVTFRRQRIVVPFRIRRDMKQKLHASHLSAISCLRRARKIQFWPGMSAEVKEMIAKCQNYRKDETNNQKESLMSHKVSNPVRLFTRCSATFWQLFRFRATFPISGNFFLSKTIPQIKTNQTGILST